jgi:hypothetical protein
VGGEILSNAEITGAAPCHRSPQSLNPNKRFASAYERIVCLQAGDGAVQRYVNMEKIVMAFLDIQDRPTIWKSFTGSWLVGDNLDGLRAEDDSRNWDAGAEWSVARSEKGNLVVYSTHCNGGFTPEMKVYDSFEALKDAAGKDGIPINIVAETAAALGVEFEIELDI